MSLFIEPGTIEVEVAGEKISAKILTARDWVAYNALVVELSALLRGKDEDERSTPEMIRESRRLQYEMLKLGFDGDPDLLRVEHWSEATEVIYKANRLDGDAEDPKD